MPQKAWGLSYTDVIGLCRLAYSDCSPNGEGKTFKLLHNTFWTITCIYNRNGFRAIAVKGFDTQKNPVRIVVFAGSDMEWNDWLLEGNAGTGILGAEYTMQYQAGLNVARSEKPNYLLGHSLGGGIANYCSLMTNIRAVTINPAPVISSTGNFAKSARDWSWSINYCVDGEALGNIRSVYANGMPGTRVTVSSQVKSNSPDPLSSVAQHKLPYLEGYFEPVRIN